MKQKAKTPLQGYLASIVAFVIATAAGILLFSIVTQHAVEDLARQKLSLNVSRQCEHFEDILDVNYQFLDGMAAQIGKYGALNTQKNRDMISAIKSTTAIDHVALIEPNGMAHFENGQIKDVSYRDYAQNTSNNSHFLSNPVQSVIDQQTRVVLSVPVFHNGTNLGHLAASYDVSVLNHLMFDDFFDGKGLCIIIDETGHIITLGENSYLKKIKYEDNFFDFYSRWNFYGHDSLQEIHNAFQDHSEGVLKLIQPGDPDSSRYIAYTPLRLKNWMMCYVIPVSVVNASYSFVQNYEMILNGYFFILVLTMILRIAMIYYKERKKLIHSAQTDGLTQVYNKEHTQYAIHAFLKTMHPGDCHAFLILDIDKFKDINDTYGHSAGDAVLQRIGEFLRSQFRDGDIIGRIGGDEFIILMKYVGSRKIARKRVESMLNEVRSMKHPELEGRPVTFSVGVVFSPESGTSFEELYQNADQALYQTKRGGRDNYTVCELT